MSASDKNSTAAWRKAMVAKGHTPVERDEDMGGGIDMFAVSYEFHNGPRCSTCGWSTCVHCQSVDSIPECDAR